MEDEYKVGVVTCYICYLKNGVLHREGGPALCFIKDEESLYSFIESPKTKKDWKLYTETYNINVDNIPAFVSMGQFHLTEQHYYLEGKLCKKEEFDTILLKYQLEKELKSNLKESKKLKV
jgi:hypothetical protein